MTILEALVEESVEFWQEALNLQHWEFDVEIVAEFEDSDVEASCLAHPYYDTARLRFHKKLPTKRVDYCVVHEMLHAHMRDHDEAIEDVISFIGYNMSRGFSNRIHNTRENLIDKLTRIALRHGKPDRVRP